MSRDTEAEKIKSQILGTSRTKTLIHDGGAETVQFYEYCVTVVLRTKMYNRGPSLRPTVSSP